MFTKRVSAGTNSDHNIEQLVQQLGKSINEDQPFPEVSDIKYPSFVSGMDFLSEVVPSNDAPSVLLLSGLDTVSFIPSTFMHVDIRGGITTFGGIRYAGVYFQWFSRPSLQFFLPSRFNYTTTPMRSKRASKRSTEVLVRLFSELLRSGLLLW